MYGEISGHYRQYFVRHTNFRPRYVFITKNESGGQFWRVVYNRMVFAAILANIVVISVVSARKEWNMAIAMSPGPLVMILFKLFCRRTFDNDIHYYRKTLTDTEGLPQPRKLRVRQEELGRKFDNPVFYHSLMSPMVWKGAEKALDTLLKGRSYSDAENIVGYDGIHLDPMSEGQPGKTSQDESYNHTPFRFVSESLIEDPDRQNEAYIFGIDEGAYDDLISERPYTPASNKNLNNPAGPYVTPPYSRTASPAASLQDRRNVSYSLPHTQRYRSQSPLSRTGYPPPPPPVAGGYSDLDAGPTSTIYSHPHQNESQSELLRGAANMPTSSSYHIPLRREHSAGSASAYTNLSYDDFRPGRR